MRNLESFHFHQWKGAEVYFVDLSWDSKKRNSRALYFKKSPFSPQKVWEMGQIQVLTQKVPTVVSSLPRWWKMSPKRSHSSSKAYLEFWVLFSNTVTYSLLFPPFVVVTSGVRGTQHLLLKFDFHVRIQLEVLVHKAVILFSFSSPSLERQEKSLLAGLHLEEWAATWWYITTVWDTPTSPNKYLADTLKMFKVRQSSVIRQV